MHPSRTWTILCSWLEAWGALVGAVRSVGREVPGCGAVLIRPGVTLFLAGDRYRGGDRESVLHPSAHGLVCDVCPLGCAKWGHEALLDYLTHITMPWLTYADRENLMAPLTLEEMD
ncbi:hypothetical protein NDU88_001386 [Pleurodeles waltl]|uniref:Uncharacterized protein n=1 Tax=Pleurodeles waltl TaxID=8319 RepID=A0AAV7NAX9_PLEWA|nr:hypothetical protein NDU88_001386 [Pleurodeles waltl]